MNSKTIRIFAPAIRYGEQTYWLRISVQLFIEIRECRKFKNRCITLKIDRVNAYAIAWALLILCYGHFLQPPNQIKKGSRFFYAF